MSTENANKNIKFDAFLKRYMQPSIYNDIRWREPLIVRQENQLSYKHVVVTGSDVITVDPRTSSHQTLFSISDIKCVTLINDSAEFLKEYIRDSTTHVSVTLRKKDAFKKSFKEKYSKRRETLRRSSAPTIDEDEDAVDRKWRKIRRLSAALLVDLNITSLQKRRPGGATSKKNPCEESSPEISETEKSPPGFYPSRSPSPSFLEVLNRVSIRRSITPTMNSRGIVSRSLSANDTYLDEPKAGPSRLCRSQLDLPMDQSKVGMNRISQSLNGIDSMGQTEQKKIHLYTLKLSNSLYVLLRNLWISSLLDDRNAKRSGPVSDLSSIRENPVSSSFESLLGDLSSEVDLQKKFELLTELKEAIFKYKDIRRLFFKDQRAMNTLLDIAKDSRDTRKLCCDDEILQTREDQLELTVACYVTINSVFSLSHGCRFKNKVMQSLNISRKIVETIVKPIPLSCAYESICERFLTDFSQLSSQEWQILPEKQLLLLHQEVIRKGVITIYFILKHLEELSANAELKKQQNMTLDFQISLLFKGICWKHWLKYVLTQILYIVDKSSKNGLVVQEESVFMYYSLSVLATLVQNIEQVRELCETDFCEEIRYYLIESLVTKCFDNSGELKNMALQLTSTIHQNLHS